YHERIELVGGCILQWLIDVEAVSPVGVIPRSDLPIGRRYEQGLRTGLIQCLARLRHLDLLKAFGNQDGDTFSSKILRHESTSLSQALQVGATAREASES